VVNNLKDGRIPTVPALLTFYARVTRTAGTNYTVSQKREHQTFRDNFVES